MSVSWSVCARHSQQRTALTPASYHLCVLIRAPALALWKQHGGSSLGAGTYQLERRSDGHESGEQDRLVSLVKANKSFGFERSTLLMIDAALSLVSLVEAAHVFGRSQTVILQKSQQGQVETMIGGAAWPCIGTRRGRQAIGPQSKTVMQYHCGGVHCGLARLSRVHVVSDTSRTKFPDFSYMDS